MKNSSIFKKNKKEENPMKNSNIFETATRNKFRFPFPFSVPFPLYDNQSVEDLRGLTSKQRDAILNALSVEDLWDLTPLQLNTILRELESEKKRTQEENLRSTLIIKVDIIRHIMETINTESCTVDSRLLTSK